MRDAPESDAPESDAPESDGGGSYSREFKLAALQRMEAGENVTALARDIGVKRKRLYEWRDRFRQEGEAGLRGRGRPQKKTPPAQDDASSCAATAAATELAAVKQRVAELERKIVQQELDLDFFRQALGHIPSRVAGQGAPVPSEP